MNGWIWGLAGGVLIGLSAVLLLWLTGRIAGISGILNGALEGPRGERSWRLAFVLGLMGAGAWAMHGLPVDLPAQATTTPWGLVVAGLLVGFGTRMGGGCTSGHGVCGLGRLSPRSLAAVVVFMLAAMVTVFVVRHVVGGGA